MVDHSLQHDVHRPARWQRIGAISGIVAAASLGVHLILLSAGPSISSSTAQVADHLVAHRTLTVAASYLSVITAISLLPFLASLRTFVPTSAPEDEWRWTVTLLAGAVAVAVLLVGSALLASAAVIADDIEDHAVAAMFAAAKVCLSSSLTPLAVMILTNTRAISPRSSPARWLIRVGLEVGAIALISGLVVFFDDNTFGPGELVTAGVGLLVGLWIVAVAVTVLTHTAVERA